MEVKALSSLEPEVCFLIREDFYYGPDRHAEVSERRLVEKLADPNIPREFPTIVRTSEAMGYERELANYYWQVVSAAQRHKKTFNHLRSYFWMRLWLSNVKEGVSISFPWYDTLSEMRRFSDAISSSESGDVYRDADQGWEINVKGTAAELFINERDPDGDEDHFSVSVPREEFTRRIAATMLEATRIVETLSEQMGADVWTAYVRDEPKFRRAKPWWRPW